MRRSLKIAVAVALAVGLVLLLLRWYDRAPKGRGVVRGTLPGMTVHPSAEADVPPAVAGVDDLATVVCRVEGDIEPGALVAWDGEAEVRSTQSGDTLIVRVDPGTWRLGWEVSLEDAGHTVRYPLGSWDLAAGDTRVCVLGAEGIPVSGRVVDHAGNGVAGAFVQGCGTSLTAGEDGSFSGPVGLGRNGGCELRARWADGALSRYSDGQRVDIFAATRPLEFEVDTEPVAGLGIAFQMEPEGVRVTMVMPGSPAYAAGLEVGDLIVRVDGVALAGMDSWEFVDLGTGREGSLARLEVAYGDVVDQVEFRRERIAAPP